MCGKGDILALSEDKDIGDSQESGDNGGEKKQVSTDLRIENAEKRCDDNEDQEKYVEGSNPSCFPQVRGLHPAGNKTAKKAFRVHVCESILRTWLRE